jgi:hypothetical protein
MTTQGRSKGRNDILIKAGLKGTESTVTRSTTIIKCQCLDTANAAANYLKSAGWQDVRVKEYMEFRKLKEDYHGKYIKLWLATAWNPGVKID